MLSSKFTSRYGKLSKINDFIVPSTGAQARRTCRRGAPEREGERENEKKEKKRKGGESEREERRRTKVTRRSTKDSDQKGNKSRRRSRGWALQRRRAWPQPWRGNPTKNACRSTICKTLSCNVCIFLFCVKKKRRPSCKGPKGIIFLHILERESKSMKNQ